MKPWLFSVHGIRTAGKWQEGATAVLDPYYQYYPIKYAEFQEWAIVKLSLDALTLLVFLGLAIALWRCHFLARLALWLIFMAAAAVAFLLAHGYAKRLRDKVVQRTYKKMTEIAGLDRAPYVVAHSLGTFIICKVLQTFQGWQYHTVILTGCVLATKFPWLEMSRRFEKVSNEVAGRDWVPYTAWLLGWFAPGMGCAGARGFKGPNSKAHNVSPEQAYPNCGGGGCSCSLHSGSETCSARIHNVFHERLEHSGYFVGLHHAWHFWLPALWGYDPVLFREFRQACQECSLLESNNAAPGEQDEAANRLRSTCWGWTRGTLEEFTKDQIRKDSKHLPPDRIEQCTDLIISVLWHNISLAARESQKMQHRDQGLMEQLEPRTALRRAIAATLEQVPWP